MRHATAVIILTIVACGERTGQASQEEAPIPGDCSRPEQLVITGDSVGPIAIGATPDLIHHVCHVISDAVELGDEAMPTRVLKIPVAQDTLEVEIYEERIWRIAVGGLGLRTRDDLGVGSSLEDLRRAGMASVSFGGAALFVQLQPHCGVSFRLGHELDEQELQEPWTVDALTKLPSTTQVDRVLIIGCR